MPVSSGPNISTRSALIVGISGVLAAALLVAFVVWATSTGEIDYQAGDSDFRNLDAERIAAEIDERGPITWANPGNEARPIWVQHFGTDPETRWLAFDARIPGQADCLAEWDDGSELFVSSCDAADTFPADGEGLDQFRVVIDDGEVIIDINDNLDGEDINGGDKLENGDDG